MNVAQRFGENLKWERKRAGLSQEELASLASLHRTHVGLLEQGLRTARIDTLVKLAGALEIGPERLLEGLGWLPGEPRPGSFRVPGD